VPPTTALAPRAEELVPSVYTPAILLLAAIVGGSFLGLGFIMPLRAIYARSIGSTAVEIGLMTTAYLLASFLAAPFIGRLTDRLGPSRLLWIGLAGHALVVIAYINVHAPVLFLALRAAEGVTAAAVIPPARAMINRLAPASRQGEALGLLSAAQEAGVLLGPAAGAFLASQVGYAPSFIIGASGLLLGAIAAFFCLPSDRPTAATVSSRQRPGLAAIGTFTRPLVLAYSLTGLIALPHGVMMALWSIYMLDRGASLPLIGLTYTAAALPGLFVAPLAGRWSDRYGRYWPIALSTVAIGAIYIVYGLPLAPIVLLVTCAVEGLITTVGRSAVDGLLADATPEGAQGRVQANFAAVTAAGRLVGSAGAGLLYLLQPGVPFIVGGVICAITGLVLFLPTIARLFTVTPAVPHQHAG
jgi:DHA1 family tetracycline resistance protein-like MFS transporter